MGNGATRNGAEGANPVLEVTDDEIEHVLFGMVAAGELCMGWDSEAAVPLFWYPGDVVKDTGWSRLKKRFAGIA